MSKTSGSIESMTQCGKGRIEVKSDGRVKCSSIKNGGNKVNGNKVGDNKIGKNQKLSKSKKLFKSKKTLRSLNFLTSGAKLAFIKLRQAFVKALILYYFDSKHFIPIEIDESSHEFSVNSL